MTSSYELDGSIEGALKSIRKEVEALLNTRLPISVGSLSEHPRTVATYGIPDLPHFSGLSFGTWSDLCNHLADTISAFEPRLTGVQVKAKKPDHLSGGLQLEILADLRWRPDLGTVSFSVAVPARSS